MSALMYLTLIQIQDIFCYIIYLYLFCVIKCLQDNTLHSYRELQYFASRCQCIACVINVHLNNLIICFNVCIV